MMQNPDDGRRDNILLDIARQKCLDRLRAAESPDAQDVMVVSLWRLEDRIFAALDGRWPAGKRAKVREYGPHWGIGAGAAGVLIALFEALGRIFGG